MKLTETQKNFRKHMKNQKFEDEPHNYHLNRRKSMFRFESSSNGNTYLISVVLVALVGIGWFAWKGNTATNSPTFYGQPIAAQDNVVTGAIPAREAYYVNSINASLKNSAQAIAEVNKYQTGALDKMDKNAYMSSLQNAISICSTEKTAISKLKAPSQFTPMITPALAYITYAEAALTNWYDYAKTGNKSFADRGNYFNSMANDSNKQSQANLESFLKENNYKYTKNQNENGGITYWYQK